MIPSTIEVVADGWSGSIPPAYAGWYGPPYGFCGVAYSWGCG